MPSSKAIKGALGFIKSMQKLVQALKDIDSAHFQQLYAQKEKRFADYDNIVKDYLKLINSVGDIAGISHPFMKPKSGTTGIIVITSDGSFMGKLNTAICKRALDLIDELKTNDVELIVIGKKGLARLKYADARLTSFPGLVENRRYEQAEKIKQYVLSRRLEGRLGNVNLVYAKCVSFAIQEVDMVRLLPAVDLFKEKLTVKVENWQEICIESPFENIMNYVIENWITRKLYDAAYESKLSEYAARSMHLEGSLEYLKGEIRKLSLSYNKARQGETDTGIRETFAALLGSEM